MASRFQLKALCAGIRVVQWGSTTPLWNQTKFAPGGLVCIQKDIAGLGVDEEHYITANLMKLWSFLCTNEHVRLCVTGPPGTGKSSTVWAWCVTVAKTKNVLWIHRGRDFVTAVRLKRGGVASCVLSANCNYETLFSDSDLVVFDGARNQERTTKLWESVAGFAANHKTVSFVIVTSTQFRSFMEDRDELGVHQTFEVLSWTSGDYVGASEASTSLRARLWVRCRASTLRDVQLKFALCGGCARWMFRMNREDIEDEIDSQIRAVTVEDLDAGFEGDKARSTISHLFGRDDAGAFLVSEFIVRKIVWRFKREFIKKAYTQNICRQNPTFDGWMWEEDVLLQARTASETHMPLKLYDSSGAVHAQWNVGEIIYFDKPDDFLDPIELQTCKRGQYTNIKDAGDTDLLWPMKWNNPCYDVGQILVKDKTIRFCQITRSAQHSLKLEYVRRMVTALCNLFEVQKVEIVVIQPWGLHKEQFCITKCDEKILAPWGWKQSELIRVFMDRNPQK